MHSGKFAKVTGGNELIIKCLNNYYNFSIANKTFSETLTDHKETGTFFQEMCNSTLLLPQVTKHNAR